MLSSLTVRGWPRRVDAAGPIPHPFHRSYEALGLRGGAPPCLLFSPRLRFGRYESTSKLLVWAGDRLACLDARRGGVVTTTMAVDEVHEVERGHALLEAWVRFVAFGPGGPAVIRVEFNAVGHDLYLPLVGAARVRSYRGAHLSAGDPRTQLQSLLPIDPRFVGYGAQSLPPGAELRRFWFQPRRVASRFGLLDQVRAAAMLLLVTQGELIVVREQGGRGAGRYGAVWSFLPLDRIQRVELVPDPERQLAGLRVTLPGGTELRADVDPARADEARAFLRETSPGWAPDRATTPAAV